MMAIFESVQSCASSKIKTTRPSIKLEDHVILSNNTYNLTEQKDTFLIAIMKGKQQKKIALNFIIIKLSRMSFTR
jgi:hypothetical protein